jgi:hypothetical protein
MYQSYKDKAAIYLIYILEAHPEDGRKMPANAKDGVKVSQPKTYEERVKVAGECIKDLKLGIPTLVDDMQNSAQKGYAAWPDRIYVVDAEGKVAYKGEPGPRGFKPGEAEEALKKLVK